MRRCSAEGPNPTDQRAGWLGAQVSAKYGCRHAEPHCSAGEVNVASLGSRGATCYVPRASAARPTGGGGGQREPCEVGNTRLPGMFGDFLPHGVSQRLLGRGGGSLLTGPWEPDRRVGRPKIEGWRRGLTRWALWVAFSRPCAVSHPGLAQLGPVSLCDTEGGLGRRGDGTGLGCRLGPAC